MSVLEVFVQGCWVLFANVDEALKPILFPGQVTVFVCFGTHWGMVSHHLPNSIREAGGNLPVAKALGAFSGGF